jgi:hypothetical protein
MATPGKQALKWYKILFLSINQGGRNRKGRTKKMSHLPQKLYRTQKSTPGHSLGQGSVFFDASRQEKLRSAPKEGWVNERGAGHVFYLIVCRGLTQAQRTAAVLERSGVNARILRTPRQVAERGCSYSVKIAQKSLNTALAALRRAGLTPTRVFLTDSDGSYREAEL